MASSKTIPPFETQHGIEQVPVKKKSRKIFMLGGWRGGSFYPYIVHIDLDKQKCEEIATLHPVMQVHGAARCMTPYGVFIGGGAAYKSLKTPSKLCTVFDPKSYEITFPIDFPARDYHLIWQAVVSIHYTVYVIGGDTYKYSVRMLDLSRNDVEWREIPSIKLKPLPRPIACAIGQTIFVLGPCTYSKKILLQVIDIPTCSCTLKSSPPPSVTDTKHASMVAVNTDFYVLGGLERLCLRYDSLTDAWEELTKPEEQHVNGSAVYVAEDGDGGAAGRIVLSGGCHDSFLSDSIEEYHIATNEWTMSPLKLPAKVSDHFMAVV